MEEEAAARAAEGGEEEVALPPEEIEVEISVEVFQQTLRDLAAAYGSGFGNNANIPHCTDILHLLACCLDKAEEDYKSFPGRSPYVNLRGDYMIGALIREFLSNEDILYDVVLALFMGPHEEASTAAARLLLAASHPYSDKAPPVIFQMFHEEGFMAPFRVLEPDGEPLALIEDDLLNRTFSLASICVSCPWKAAFERLASWVTGDVGRPRIVFALGLLAVILVDREIADYIVRSDISQSLLQSLRTSPLHPFLFGSPEEKASAVASLSAVSLPGMANEHLLELEVIYSLNCLALMGEYQEILSPFFQGDGMELVMALLKQQDFEILFASAEFVSRLLAHKKVAMAFVNGGGVEALLKITESDQVSKLHGVLALCLFGLASLVNVMEAVCRLPSPHFPRLVSYAISLLSCPQEHTQKHAVLFFSLALTFRPVLEAFDDEDGQGLYCLLNILRTSPNGLTQQRRGQLAHYTCLCLRHYLRIHLALHASGPPPLPGAEARAGFKRPRSGSQDGVQGMGSSSYFKPVEVDDSSAEAIINAVKAGSLTVGQDWFPLQRMLHYRGILVLLGVVASTSGGRTGAAETARFALDCLEILTLHPCTLTEACLEDVVEHRTGIQILLEAASGLVQRDAEVMKGALRVLCNCLRGAGGTSHAGGSLVRMSSGGGGSGEGGMEAPEERVRRSICKSIRKENGIKILVSLLRYRRCIQAADEVRMLATTALSGLAHESQIAQILEKMRLSLILSEVVRAGPVMERSSDHYKTLRTAATQLIARITGRPTSTVSHSEAMDPAAWKLEKAGIVARTPIRYDGRELLVLIRNHLLSQGLFQAARALEDEAELGIQRQASAISMTSPPCSFTESADIPHGEQQGDGGNGHPPPWESPPARAPKRARSSIGSSVAEPAPASGPPKTSQSHVDAPVQPKSKKVTAAPPSAPTPEALTFTSPTPSAPKPRAQSHHMEVTPAPAMNEKETGGGSADLTRSSSRHAPRLFPVGLSFRRRSSTSRASLQSPSFMDVFSPNKMNGAAAEVLSGGDTPIPTAQVLGLQAPYLHQSCSSLPDNASLPGNSTTLDQIVVQYLRTQHEKCPEPICVLPPFSLTLPHHCPESTSIGASRNVAKRIMQRQMCPPFGGRRGGKATRSLIFSRFRPWRSYRDEDGHTITVSAFHRGENMMWVGTSPGTVRLVNLWTMEAEKSWDCHQWPVTSISMSSGLHRSPLVMTCAHVCELGDWQGETMIWSADDLTTPLLRLPDLRSPVFDATSTRVAGLTPSNMGVVYDAETGSRLRQLVSVQGDMVTTQYKNPNICFSLRDDHMVLTDGSLWDLRTSRLLHRFDKLSNGGFGAFNPNGNEVIIDNSVWDLRSYNLLKMTGLDSCHVQFSAFGDVVYGFRRVPADDALELFQNRNKRTREYNSFSVLDGLDYSLMHVQELDKQVMDLAVDYKDMHLAVVETNMLAPMDDNVCRLYEVGRQRPNEADSDIDDAHSDSGDDDDDWDGGDEEEDDDSQGEGDLDHAGEDEDHSDDDEDLSVGGGSEGEMEEGLDPIAELLRLHAEGGDDDDDDDDEEDMDEEDTEDDDDEEGDDEDEDEGDDDDEEEED